MKNFVFSLNDRSIITLEGVDSVAFLQGLVTNDIKENDKKLTYCLMQSPKGRFLYEFFVFFAQNRLFLDVFADRADEIIKKLNFYKLKKQVKITKIEDISVYFSPKIPEFSNNLLFFADPRVENFGFRIYSSLQNNENLNILNQEHYELQRILNKIPESEKDLFYDKSIAAEFDMDNLNAISYEKGCYMGQELTARTHYLGEVRKKIFLVEIFDFTKISKGDKVLLGDNEIGIALSSATDKDKQLALIIVKTSEKNFIDKHQGDLTINNVKIKLIK